MNIDICESIRRQLRQLEDEFSSDENGRTGRLKFAEFSQRSAALVKRLREAERAPPAPRPAPALTRADLDAVLRLPKIAAPSSEDRAELDAFRHVFDEMARDQKVSSARDVLKNPRRIALAQAAGLAQTAGTLRESYDRNGAGIFGALVVGGISALRNELSELRLELRVLRAHCERLERALSLRGKAAR
ncbi:MAG: hypothetical protein A3H32_14380 [Betaproteobacteria bacterium RIFCSPLOWO2_02_FULL_63_19]|nr:MAG: hypothetical protein A3H32_14380 [Betaproteobacteria bacterium RIFCSPLOWO2_02_FULL_63_19]